MRSLALTDMKRRTYYDKQRGNERTLFKVMALNDFDGGDIGYLYFNNRETETTRAKDLPVLEEKVKFTEFNNLTIIG
jgi:hypothetical protein